MTGIVDQEELLSEKGYMILDDMYTSLEVECLSRLIESADSSSPTFRKDKDVFAIRRFLEVVPGAKEIIFNNRLRELVYQLAGVRGCLVKSIYFDKPEHSNWFVAWHQDLTISVDKKVELRGYGPWTVKQQQFAVQPPVGILEKIYTIRLHLDHTDEANGALNVIPGSHRYGVCKLDTINLNSQLQETSVVKSGGVMIMKPLLFHRSFRSTSIARRRVIHMEFCAEKLPEGLGWSELSEI